MSGVRPAAGEPVVVPVALVPVRAEPTHRSERVSEWLLGEVVSVERLDGGWMMASGPDGYRGWTPAGPFRVPAAATAAWHDAATLFSRGADVDGGPLRRLPWGARLAPSSDGALRLPDGSTVRVADPTRVAPVSRASGDGASAGAIVADAREWLGVPYGWGGRTELGVDCSGFVQAVYAAHGVRLPRDSGEQSEAGPLIAAGHAGDSGAPEAGDLLFFAPEGRGVTHVALCAGGTRILHAASSRGGVCEDDLAAENELAARLRDSRVAVTRPLAGRGPSTPPDRLR
jgi:cell wall-associated NlpC family hydrolase